MPTIQTEAITLRRRRLRDADAIVTLYTLEHGKVAASLRSALKTNSRMAGITQPFNRMDAALYAKSEDQTIWTLTQTALIRQYETIQNDLARMAYASCVAEWIEALSAEFESGREVWNLLVHALDRWEESKPTMEDLFFYQWRLLCQAGLQPDVSSCAGCDVESAPTWFYDAGAGRAHCQRCRASELRDSEALPMSGATLDAVRVMLNAKTFPSVRLTTPQRNEMIRFLQRHLEYHAEVRLNTAAFFHQMGKINAM